jgi:pantoate--beta-alanine ligase
VRVLTSVAELQALADAERAAGRRLALVPTMGALHAGHLSLVAEGRRRADRVWLSIFVNPTQFEDIRDLAAYPRTLEADLALCREAGVDLVFAPSAAEMRSPGAQTWVEVTELAKPLCGRSRPGHFRGVATVVTQLLLAAKPHVAVFGQKDFQQLAVIRRMTLDLNLPVEIVGMPIVREADGLAMSSRNVYLSPGERQQALVLSRAIAAARQLARDGVRDCGEILAAPRAMIEEQSDARIDYLQICHQLTLQAQERADGDSVLLMAVLVGKTRLIDYSFLLR